MASTQINPDGTITITLDAKEQALSAMVLEDRGADVLTEVFQLWFDNTVKATMNERFARLDPLDQVNLLVKMSQAKPVDLAPGKPLTLPGKGAPAA